MSTAPELDRWDVAVTHVTHLREVFDDQGWCVEDDLHDPYAFTATKYGDLANTHVKVYIDETAAGLPEVYAQREVISTSFIAGQIELWARGQK